MSSSLNGLELCGINDTNFTAVRSLHRQYYWYDERGKKIKCTAPQYVDFVMSSVQKLVTDEDVFPTKYGTFSYRTELSHLTRKAAGGALINVLLF